MTAPTPQPAPRKRRRKKTNVDVEAMELLMTKLMEMKSITLDMGSPQAARRLRFQFYEWRTREQDLNGTHEWDEVIVRLDGPSINFSAQGRNPQLRQAMAKAGLGG